MAFTLRLGANAPDFSLLSTEGTTRSLDDYRNKKGLVIFFTCNHCPYVKNSDEHTRQLADTFIPQDIAFVAINSNSSNTYAEDSYEEMVRRMEMHHFPWDYLHDASQQVALAYGALRTPHFYLFDNNQKLIYTGRAIDKPRDPSNRTTNELEDALSEYIQGKPISTPLTNPIGCNVKWEGKDRHWMPPDACDIV